MKIKIPKGMTEDEVLLCIESVCKNLSYKYRFGYYDLDDIKQEAFIIGIKGLYDYDGSIPLKNFLYIHISNRLKNLKRDYHFRQPTICNKCRNKDTLCEKCLKKQETAKIRQNIMSPIDVDAVKADGESNMQYSINYDELADNNLIIETLEREIPKDLREDYLKFKDGAYIPSLRKQKLINEIERIIEEHGYNENKNG